MVETTTIVEQNLGNQASKVSHNNLTGWEILGGFSVGVLGGATKTKF
jgi:hypothetical protein